MAGVIEWALGSRWAALSLCAGALIACGNTSNPPNGAAGSSALGGASSSAGSTASGGGASGSGTTNGGAANGGAGGSGTATSGSGGAAELEPTNIVAACVYYARHYCERIAQCQGRAESCDGAGDLCPDLVLSEGSTRTLAGLISCAKEWDQFSCKSMALGLQPDCITPGTKQVGEACLFPSQCSTLSCSGNYVENKCGECQTVGAGGAESDCSETLGCPGFLNCTADNKCTPTVTIAAQAGESCADSLCTAGTRCTDPAKICTPYPTAGQPCPDNVCDSSLYCAPGSICKKYPRAESTLRARDGLRRFSVRPERRWRTHVRRVARRGHAVPGQRMRTRQPLCRDGQRR